MPSRRVLKVASRLKFLISTIIQRELHDPRIGFVTVMKVEPTEDFKEAKVHVSVFGAPGDKSKTLHALEAARGYIQSRVGKNLRLRHTPALEFVLDTELEKLGRVERLIEAARSEAAGGELPHGDAGASEAAEGEPSSPGGDPSVAREDGEDAERDADL